MSAKKPATFYYDIVSPFAYLYVKQRHRLESKLEITPVPILLGGLLRSTDNKGPGEVAAKRPHTYQFCVWQAEKLNIDRKSTRLNSSHIPLSRMPSSA